jgi:hypothetical protein
MLVKFRISAVNGSYLMRADFTKDKSNFMVFALHIPKNQNPTKNASNNQPWRLAAQQGSGRPSATRARPKGE